MNKIYFSDGEINILYHLYVSIGLNVNLVGRYFGISNVPIKRILRERDWLRPRPVKGSKRPEHSERMKGENNPFYGRSWSEPELAESLEEMKASFSDRSGENNSNWRGGHSALNHLYNDHRYTLLKEEALKRDGCRCRMCGSTDHLEFHHIYNALKHPEKFFNLDNIITLCRRCHRTKTYKHENEYIDVCLRLLEGPLPEPTGVVLIIASWSQYDLPPEIGIKKDILDGGT